MKRISKKWSALFATAALVLSITSFTLPVGATAGYDAVDPAFTGHEWYDQIDVVEINRENPRTLFAPFDTPAAAKANPTYSKMENSTGNFINLNGTWDFHLSTLTTNLPDFYKTDFVKDTNWKTIPVPSSWQVAGQYAGFYGDYPIYQNQNYPWQAYGMASGISTSGGGSSKAPAGTTTATRNPVGSYMRDIFIPTDWGTKQCFISFMGVSQGMYLWVNGRPVGYAEDSWTAKEWDITPYIIPGQNNKIAARVYRWTTGGFWENQDQIDVSGIARDVYMTAAPKTNIKDFTVVTDLVEFNEQSDANLNIKFLMNNRYGAAVSNYKLSVSLFDKAGTMVFENESQTFSMDAKEETKTLNFTKLVTNPAKWSSEFPNLYTAVFSLYDSDNNHLESVGQRVGFRELVRVGANGNNADARGWNTTGNAADPNRLRINGKALYLKGVNRGEMDALGGKTIPRTRMLQEVKWMKQSNINSVRTSHYPHDPYMYELYDEYGIYVQDEFNMESHNGRSAGMDGNNAVGNFANSQMDRAVNTVMRDKNFPSVIMYSLGNECGAGPNHQANYAWVRANDPTRFIHFQASSANMSDMQTRMYESAATENSYSDYNKPNIPCEYEHAMGNAGGGLFAYVQGFENNPRNQGGWIWDWYDQSIRTYNSTGDYYYYGYGGDWGESSHSNSFSSNGIGVLPNNEKTPSLAEVRAQYQDIKMTVADEAALVAGNITFKNHALFTNTNAYDFVWEVLENNTVVKTGTMSLAIEATTPSETVAVANIRNIPYELPTTLKPGAEYFLNLSFRLKNATAWADAGYMVSGEQFQLPVITPLAGVGLSAVPALSNVDDTASDKVVITGTTNGKAFSLTISKVSGLITEYKVDGKVLLNNGPVPNYYRALVDNDIGGTYSSTSFGARIGKAWRYAGRDKTITDLKVMQINSKTVQISVSGTLPSKNASQADAPSQFSIEYTVYGNGDIVVNNKLAPNANAYVMGLMGSFVQLPLEYDNVKYFGRGPEENYIDRRSGTEVGVYTNKASEMHTPYFRTQEGGNRTDTRWVSVTNNDGFGLLAVADDLMEFSAVDHTAEEMSTWNNSDRETGPRHPEDMAAPTAVTLNLNLIQMGVGSENWSRGPYGQEGVSAYGDFMVRPNKDYEYTYTLRPLFAAQDEMVQSKSLVVGEPMLKKILINGVPLATFDEKVKAYNYTITPNANFPVITVETYDGVIANITQATASAQYAVINLTKGEEQGAYTINFARDMNFLTDILLTGETLKGFNPIVREFSAQWPSDQPLPTITVAAAAGIQTVITQPTVENEMKGSIVATNDFGDTQNYKITVVLIKDFDEHRPSIWGHRVDIQTLPIGDVKYIAYSGGSHNQNYYYVTTAPESATARGDVPFVGLYPNRRLATGADGTGDKILIDPTTNRRVYSHKNVGTAGNAVGDTLVGLEHQNGTNIAGQTIVMYSKFKPVNGGFALSFRDGSNECRNASEIFKISFVPGTNATANGTLRYSTTTSSGSNGAVAVNSMTTIASNLPRNTYYEVWMLDTPISSGANMGHNVVAYIKYTNAQGEEVFLSTPMRRQTTTAATTMNWPVFNLYEGNGTAEVYIEDFDVYTINTESPLLTYKVAGDTEIRRPQADDNPSTLQLSAAVVHTAEDNIPVPFLSGAKWEILSQDSYQGVSIDQTGKITLTTDFVDTYFDVKVSNPSDTSPWIPATARINVVTFPAGVALNKSSETLPIDGTLQLTATVVPNDAANKTVIWSSSASTIASVDDTGKVTALRAGTAIITASCEADSSVSATCEVTVAPAVSSVTVSPETLTLLENDGSETPLTAVVLPNDTLNKNVTWSTSDANVAVVSETGVVSPKNAGTATITATTEDGAKTATCAVIVKPTLVYTANTGDTVSLPITLNDCNKLAGISGTIAYDESLLTLQSISAKSEFTLYSSGNSFVAVTKDGMGLDGTVVVGYVVFTVKADLPDDVTTFVTFPTEAITAYDQTTTTVHPEITAIALTITGIPPLVGDVNLDGVVDLADAILLMQHLSGSIDLSSKQLKAADINKDGAVNVGDVIIIMQMCLED